MSAAARHAGGPRPGVPRAKTAVPRLPPRHLPRPRLQALLGGDGDSRVTLVSAPAGYGKTLLLAEWAAGAPEITAWVSLDEDDNDSSRLWSAVLAALSSCSAVPADNALHALGVPARPRDDQDFLAAVLTAVEAVPRGLRLVLDDVHELTSPDALHGLDALVRHRPPAPGPGPRAARPGSGLVRRAAQARPGVRSPGWPASRRGSRCSA